MKKLFLFLIVIPLYSLALSIKIPIVAIDYGISKVFPIEKTLVGNSIKVFNPKLIVEDNKFKLKTDYESKTILKKFSGNMFFESDIRFDPLTYDIYLDKVKLVKITNSKKEYLPESNFISRNLLKGIYTVIESKSIYNTKEHALTKLLPIKDIDIVKNELLVVF